MKQQRDKDAHPWRVLAAKATSRRVGLRLGMAGLTGIVAVLATACDGGGDGDDDDDDENGNDEDDDD